MYRVIQLVVAILPCLIILLTCSFVFKASKNHIVARKHWRLVTMVTLPLIMSSFLFFNGIVDPRFSNVINWLLLLMVLMLSTISLSSTLCWLLGTRTYRWLGLLVISWIGSLTVIWTLLSAAPAAL